MRALVAIGLCVALAPAGAADLPARPEAARDERPLRVLFPEGFSARQMVDRVAAVRRIAISKRGVKPRLTGRAYAEALRRAQPPREFRGQVRRRSVEGFLFPALYEFTRTTSARSLVARQIDVFRQRWSAVDLTAAKARGRTPYEVLIIASMVEREVVAPAERRLVAAVIYNRLERGMRLAIDATIRYGLGIPGTRPLTKAQLASDSPYNTRRHPGLPPTPIANPGLAAIRAAARPASVDFLFYVRKPDGVHHFFTADEAEFCAKAREYGYGC